MPECPVRFDEHGAVYLSLVTGVGGTPPVPSGVRVTDCLSPRAARRITRAAIKADAVGLPLRAFYTFTLKPWAREWVAQGGTTLGAEMRRTLDVVNKRAKREGKKLAFIWVAENPGGSNPHVHCVTSNMVSRDEFADYAAWLESVWDLGYVHLEKIKYPAAAGRYLLKAVEYSIKGGVGGQGEIVGNRYGISRCISPTDTKDLVVVPDDVIEGFYRVKRDIPTDRVLRFGEAIVLPYGVYWAKGSPEKCEKTLAALEMVGYGVSNERADGAARDE